MTPCVPLVLQDAVRYLEKLAGLLLFLTACTSTLLGIAIRIVRKRQGTARPFVGHCTVFSSRKREGTKLMDWIVGPAPRGRQQDAHTELMRASSGLTEELDHYRRNHA